MLSISFSAFLASLIQVAAMYFGYLREISNLILGSSLIAILYLCFFGPSASLTQNPLGIGLTLAFAVLMTLGQLILPSLLAFRSVCREEADTIDAALRQTLWTFTLASITERFLNIRNKVLPELLFALIFSFGEYYFVIVIFFGY